MAVNLEQFVQSLHDSGLMTAEDSGAILDSLPPDEKPKSAEEFARLLHRRKRLTAFQVQSVYQGKAQGLVLGNYVVLDRIGQGGMGQVFKAEHRRMRRIVALKVLPRGLAESSGGLLRFQREVEAAAQLAHPNIVTAYDADEANGAPFLVMEYVEGSDLASLVAKEGPLVEGRALDYILQAARGLEYAHSRKMIHRDIKPSNLLLDGQGVVKILDMGLARFRKDGEAHGASQSASLTETGQVMGTIDYMAPEQALDFRRADERSDIYSLGCTLFYLLTGRAVYGGESLTARLVAHQEAAIPSLCEIRPELTPELDAVLRRMVAKSPEQRYQTASEVIAQVEACLQSPAGGLAPGPPTSRQGQPAGLVDATPTPASTLSHARVSSRIDTRPEPVLEGSAEALTDGPLRPQRRSRRGRAVAAGVLCGLALIAVAWGVVVKIRTRDGTLVIHLSQPGSQVEILDPSGNIQIQRPGQQGTLRISVDPGEYRLKVEKEGFRFYTTEFTIESRGLTELEARLEPLQTARPRGGAGAGEATLAQMLASGEWEWAPPENLGPVVNSPAGDSDPEVSRDGRTLLFCGQREDTARKLDIWICTRPAVDAPWSKPWNLGSPVNTNWLDGRPTISADGLTLFFTSDRPGGKGVQDLWSSSRPSVEAAWTQPINMDFNTTKSERDAFLTGDGLSLLYCAENRLMVCTRQSPTHPWSPPSPLAEEIESTEASNEGPWLSDDGLVLLFDRRGVDKSRDLWMATRATRTATWRRPVKPGINSPWRDCAPSYCPAEQALYFASDRAGGQGNMDLWKSRLVRTQRDAPAQGR